MPLYILRFFILCGLFLPSLAPAVTPVLLLPGHRVFDYAEANYPDLFKNHWYGGEQGIYQQYRYRYYSASGNYLGIDPMGELAMLGPATGNVLTSVGSVADYFNDIIAWESAQPLALEGTTLPPTLARVSAYARNHYPDLFPFLSSSMWTISTDRSTVVNCSPLRRGDPTYNCIAISLTTGDIFIEGIYTGEVVTYVGNVADYEGAIREWESKPNMRLDYPGFTIWMDCSRRSAMQFVYVAQPDTGNTPPSDSFFLDPDVPTDCQQADTSVYGMNYTSGHLVPPNHLGPSTEAIEAANTVTNILPQAANMNAGAWRRTEEIARCYSSTDELLVMGGVFWSLNYSANDHFVQSHGIETPVAFWKVIIRRTGQDQQAIAWLIPNSQEATWDRLDQYLVPINEVKARAGLSGGGSSWEKPSQSWEIPASCDESQ